MATERPGLYVMMFITMLASCYAEDVVQDMQRKQEIMHQRMIRIENYFVGEEMLQEYLEERGGDANDRGSLSGGPDRGDLSSM